MLRRLKLGRTRAWFCAFVASVVFILAVFSTVPARADSSQNACISVSSVFHFFGSPTYTVNNSCGQSLAIKYTDGIFCQFLTGGCPFSVPANSSAGSFTFAPSLLLACPAAQPPQGTPIDIGGVYCQGDRQPLTVIKSGIGSGTVTGASGISCGTGGSVCSGSYAPGQTIALTATPQAGSNFTAWSGACTGNGACNLTMSSAQSVTANFDPIVPSTQLTITVSGPGKVTSSTGGITCQGSTGGPAASCGAVFALGASITFTAATVGLSNFSGWGGSCSGVSGNSCTVTVSSTTTVSASFSPIAFLSVSVDGPGKVTSSPGGISCAGDDGAATVCGAQFSPGQTVQLTAVQGTAPFLGWGGACGNVPADVFVCTVTVSTTSTFSVVSAKYESSQKLSITVKGQGAAVGAADNINCADFCQPTFGKGHKVTLTAVPRSNWTFGGWSGACTGNGVCVVTMDDAKSVVATFTDNLRIGSIFSTAQPSSQSFLRFFNTSTTANTVTVTLSDSVTGQAIATWTSPTSIPSGASLQYSISDLEQSAQLGFSKPSYYSISVAAGFLGFVQHVLFHPSDGTLTNLSTCSRGVTANLSRIANVHSSVIGDLGFPSTIIVSNDGLTVATATLGVYDAASGLSLGSYLTAPIAGNNQSIISVATLEKGAGISPTTKNIAHYVVKIENAEQFTGHLQHTVNNARAGVLTDMTTVCSLDPSYKLTSSVALNLGGVFSTLSSSTRSFFRFSNVTASSGAVVFSFFDYNSGKKIGDWTSPPVFSNQSQQFAVESIQKEILPNGSLPTYYSIIVKPQVNGYFQHILYFPTNGAITNSSTCSTGVTSNTTAVANVHSAKLASIGFPSTIVIFNKGLSAASPRLGLYDSATGAKYGVLTTTSPIAANGQLILPVSTIEKTLPTTRDEAPTSQYVVKLENPDEIDAYLQHLVNNQAVGVVTDMTTSCRVAPNPPFLN